LQLTFSGCCGSQPDNNLLLKHWFSHMFFALQIHFV
jgi:hypothetical protein